MFILSFIYIYFAILYLGKRTHALPFCPVTASVVWMWVIIGKVLTVFAGNLPWLTNLYRWSADSTKLNVRLHTLTLHTFMSFCRNGQKYTLWYWQYWNFRNCSEITDFWFSLKKWLKYQQCVPSQNPTNHPKNLILTYQFCCTKMKQF